MFHAAMVSFLGFIIAKGEIKMDPEINAVLGSPKMLQMAPTLLGLYQLVAPLTTLTLTSRQFIWSPKTSTAFLELKTQFTLAPVLCHADPTRQFVLKMHASDVSVEAVLSQRSSKDSKFYPCG